MSKPLVVTVEVDSIGAVAGHIWHDLKQNGPMTLSRLATHIDAPRDLVMQGVGWLAREGKVRFQKKARSRLIELT